jgi:hypothetical protein
MTRGTIGEELKAKRRTRKARGEGAREEESK